MNPRDTKSEGLQRVVPVEKLLQYNLSTQNIALRRKCL